VRTFGDLLQHRAAEEPQRRAFRFLDYATLERPALTITYAELDRQARTVAALLQQYGRPGARALLSYPPGLEGIAALFGCLYAGWIAVPAPVPTPARGERWRTAAITHDAQPTVALTTHATRARLATRSLLEPSLPSERWLATDDLPAALADVWRPVPLEPDAVAILQYTSGSLSRPRGVILHHANLLHNTGQIARRFGITRDSRGMIWLPAFHDMGLIGGILQGVYSGFPVTLMAPAAFLQRPVRWLQAISEERATISGAPNVAYDLCVERITPAERATLDLACWTVAFNGSEPVRLATLERFASTFAACGFRRTALAPCYGLAEATLMVSAVPVGRGPSVKRHGAADVVSCGPPIDDTRLLVVDPDTRSVCQAGQVGEVWLAGPSVAGGYWRQPAATRATFAAQLQPQSDPPDSGYLRTGDLGFVAGGELFISGRLKAQLVLAGRNLQAEDVERTVASSHAAGWPGGLVATSSPSRAEDGREHLVIVQEIDPRRAPTEASRLAIIQAIRRCVAEQYQVPVAAIVLARPGSIPRTSSGKVRRQDCARAYAAGELEVLVAWQLGPRDRR